MTAQSCEATRMKEEMDNHLENKDEEWQKMKEKIDILTEEIDQMNKSLKLLQTLDHILSHQGSHLDKSSLGYVGEP